MSTHDIEFKLSPTQSLWVLVEFTPGTPAQLSGPPEDCYPEDPPELEIVEATLQTTAGSNTYLTPVTHLVTSLLAEERLIQRCLAQLISTNQESPE